MLKRAGTPAPTATSSPPGAIPRHRGDLRPWIRQPGYSAHVPTATERIRGEDVCVLADPKQSRHGVYMTRASGFGDVLEDKYKIGRARERRIVFGLSRAPELVRAAQAVRGQDEPTDRGELERLADKAVEYARGNAAAMSGTAFHRLREQHDAGEDLSHLDALTRRGLDTWRRLLDPFEVMGSEQFVVNDTINAAGTYDALLELVRPVTIRDKNGAVRGRLEAGERVIGDLKSGRWGPSWFGPGYGVQAWTYALGVPYAHESGRGDWPDRVAPSTSWAVIPWVSLDDLDAARLVWIDLHRAGDLVALAQDIRAARKAEGLFCEDTAGGPMPTSLAVSGVAQLLAQAADRGELERLWVAHQSVWTEALTRLAQARLAELEVAL